MSRPADLDYRAAILGAFDRHTIRSLKEINNHLKELGEFKSYQSSRRMLIKLCNEGVLSELPKRGDKNAVFYTKLMLNQSTVKLISPDNELVSLNKYISAMIDYEFSSIVDEQAGRVIKQWILDSLASSYPEGYVGKREIPDHKGIERKLKGTLEMTRKLHHLLKTFLDSDVFTPVARENLAAEFRESAAVEHVIIVEKRWDV